MALKFGGSISYIKPSVSGENVSLSVEGNFSITKGTLDYFATPDWQTVWRIYDRYGQLLFDDARHHAIMVFAAADTANDNFKANFKGSGDVFTIQVYGRIGGETKFIDQKSVNVSSSQVVSTPASVPQPEPEEQEPVTIGDATVPTPGEDTTSWLDTVQDSSLMGWGWLKPIAAGAGVIVVALIAYLLISGRRR